MTAISFASECFGLAGSTILMLAQHARLIFIMVLFFSGVNALLLCATPGHETVTASQIPVISAWIPRRYVNELGGSGLIGRAINAGKFPDSKLARPAGKNKFVAVTVPYQQSLREHFLLLAARRSVRTKAGAGPTLQPAIRHRRLIMNSIPLKESR